MGTGGAAAMMNGFVPHQAFATSGSSAEESRPNIILIIADDMGPADTNYAGVVDYIKTPNLDTWSTEGVRFDKMYSACPWCSPTRGSFMTGRSAARFYNVGESNAAFPTDEVSIAEVLRAHGYATMHFGKWHLGDKPGYVPHHRGFENAFWNGNNCRHVDPDEYRYNDERLGVIEGEDCEILTSRTIDFIHQSVDRGAPFFANLWFHVPHGPFGTTQEYIDMYPELDEKKAIFWGQISALDDQVGRLRRELRSLGIADNTLVWFSGDNGGISGAQSEIMHGGKTQTNEGAFRVPALLDWPALIKEPIRTDMACCSYDFAPTVLDILGISSDNLLAPLDGMSILPLLKGEMTERPGPLYLYNHNHKHDSYVLREKRYRLDTYGDGRRFLYDLETDPKEKNDLIQEMPEKAAEMQAEIDDWFASILKSREGADYSTAANAVAYPRSRSTDRQLLVHRNGREIAFFNDVAGHYRVELVDMLGRSSILFDKWLGQGEYRHPLVGNISRSVRFIRLSTDKGVSRLYRLN